MTRRSVWVVTWDTHGDDDDVSEIPEAEFTSRRSAVAFERRIKAKPNVAWTIGPWERHPFRSATEALYYFKEQGHL